jgi:DNA-binding NtrC family response regulator
VSPTIILVETSKVQRTELTTLLEARGFQVMPCRTIFDVDTLCQEDNPGLVILDLDNPLINNRVLRDLKRKHSAIHLIGTSSRLFHPELKDAISNYIYACLCKPVDPDELIYLVKSIFSHAANSKEIQEEDAMEGSSFTTK